MALSHRPRPLLAIVLVMLLVSTTPIGTGGAIHHFDLLHPLFAHLHIYDGRIVTHEQLAEAMAARARTLHAPMTGLALGAGSASATGDLGLDLSPVMPPGTIDALIESTSQPFGMEVRLPNSRTEAPPDPPPMGGNAL
jgi:hypothetical protein